MKQESLWSPAFVMVILISFCDSMTYMMPQFMISSYALDLGTTKTMAATVVSVISVASLVMRPLAGRLVDSYSQKRLLILALGGVCLSMLLYSLAADYRTLLVARLVHGLCYGLSTVAAITIAGGQLPNDRIGSGIAIYGMGNTVCVIFSTKIAQLLYGAGGAEGLFAAGLAFALCALVLALLLPAATKKRGLTDPAGLSTFLRNLFAKQALPFAFLSMLFSASQAINSAFMVLYFRASEQQGICIGDAGVALMLWGVAIFLCRPLVGRLCDRVGFAAAAAVCMSCSALYTVLLGLSRSAWMTYLGTLLLGGPGGCSASVLQAAAYAAAPLSKKGAASSTNLMGGDVGAAVGGVLCGWSVTAFSDVNLPSRGYRISYLLCAIPLVLAVCFCLLLRKHRLMRPSPMTELS